MLMYEPLNYCAVVQGPPHVGLGVGHFNAGVHAVSGDSHVTLGPPPLVEDPSAYNEVEMEDTERSEWTKQDT